MRLKPLEHVRDRGRCCRGPRTGAACGPTPRLSPVPAPPVPPRFARDTHCWQMGATRVNAIQFQLHECWASSPCGTSSGPSLLVLIDTAHLPSRVPHVNLCPYNPSELHGGFPARALLAALLCSAFQMPLPLSSLLASPSQPMALLPLLSPSSSHVLPSPLALFQGSQPPSQSQPPCTSTFSLTCWLTSQSPPPPPTQSPRASRLITPASASPSPEHPASPEPGSLCASVSL